MSFPFPHLGVSYYGNRYLSHARLDLKRIAAVCDYVVHTVSETDLTYHKAVLSKLVAETHRSGLEVWVDPWGLGGVFGGESFSKFLVENRNSWQVMSNGRIMPAACLNRPEWISYVKEWILNVRDMGAQVIFWDEPHVSFDLASEMAGIYSCICETCQALFKKQHGTGMPSKIDDRARQFRRDTMKNFLNELMTFARSKNFKNALCLYAFKGNKEYDLVWKEAAALPYLDIFGCDPYWRWRGTQAPDVHVGEFSRHVVQSARANNKQSQVWIQAMRLPAGTENEIERAVRAAVNEGITHIAAWSFDGGELLDTVLSERPEAVWQAVEKVYAEIKANK